MRREGSLLVPGLDPASALVPAVSLGRIRSSETEAGSVGRRLRRWDGPRRGLELSPLEAGILSDEVRAPVETRVVCERASRNDFGPPATDAFPLAIWAPPS